MPTSHTFSVASARGDSVVTPRLKQFQLLLGLQYSMTVQCRHASPGALGPPIRPTFNTNNPTPRPGIPAHFWRKHRWYSQRECLLSNRAPTSRLHPDY